MKNLNKHIQEYYQGTKFLGTTTHEGDVSQDQVGYHGRTFITDGTVRLKRVHKASAATPIMVVR